MTKLNAIELDDLLADAATELHDAEMHSLAQAVLVARVRLGCVSNPVQAEAGQEGAVRCA